MVEQQERARARQQRILDAALRVFSRRGYRDASVGEIADVSRTSKGGVYFHFPGKEAIFLHLLNRTAARLRDKIESAMAVQEDPVAKADAALLAVLRTFAKHRALARLFMVEALGAGREFHRRMAEIRGEFAGIIERHLDEAVRQGVIPPVDTEIAGQAWFGALNEVMTAWVLSGRPGRLEDAYIALRPILVRSVGAEDVAGRSTMEP
ncbi:MAG: TetR family transcriptional regulator [Chloroflexi bacterium RBG_16_68_14]|nr:MAG: TetR family transcriptional regulator [Chloroflexi bacterium RBG_16_68_14]